MSHLSIMGGIKVTHFDLSPQRGHYLFLFACVLAAAVQIFPN